MVLHMFEAMVEFIESNPLVIALVMAIVQYVKQAVQGYDWYKGWHVTAFAFALAFLFAIPAEGFVLFEFIASGLGLGLVATGLYDVIRDIAKSPPKI